MALDISVPWCETSDPIQISSTQTVVLLILAVIFILSVVGTTLDVLPKLVHSFRRAKGEKIPPPARQSKYRFSTFLVILT